MPGAQQTARLQVGMFDNVRCRYPLPHHQDAEFQTKDLASVVEGEYYFGGLLDDYTITKNGRLRRQMHQRKWVKNSDSPLGGYFKSIKSWWEYVPDVHGDVRIYTSDGTFGKRGYRWIEFLLRFTNGRVQSVRDVSRDMAKPKRRWASQAATGKAKRKSESS